MPSFDRNRRLLLSWFLAALTGTTWSNKSSANDSAIQSLLQRTAFLKNYAARNNTNSQK